MPRRRGGNKDEMKFPFFPFFLCSLCHSPRAIGVIGERRGKRRGMSKLVWVSLFLRERTDRPREVERKSNIRLKISPYQALFFSDSRVLLFSFPGQLFRVGEPRQQPWYDRLSPSLLHAQQPNNM